jgi:hypothetical protein
LALSKHGEPDDMMDYLAKARHYRAKAAQLWELAHRHENKARARPLMELAQLYEQLAVKFLERAAGFPL